MMFRLEDADQTLIDKLQELGDKFGRMGVALVASLLTDQQALINLLVCNKTSYTHCTPFTVGDRIDGVCSCKHLRLIHSTEGVCPSCKIIDHINSEHQGHIVDHDVDSRSSSVLGSPVNTGKTSPQRQGQG